MRKLLGRFTRQGCGVYRKGPRVSVFSSQKSKGARMGKGKGAVVGPFYRVKPGWPLFRFIAASRAEAQSLHAIAQSKLRVRVTLVTDPGRLAPDLKA